jgi:hypothetical protein
MMPFELIAVARSLRMREVEATWERLSTVTRQIVADTIARAIEGSLTREQAKKAMKTIKTLVEGDLSGSRS